MSTRSVAIGGEVARLERLPSDGVMVDAGGAGLRELTRSAVRTALRADRRGLRLESEVLPILGLTCDIARAQNIMVERVLILLKEAWREQPEARPKRYSDAEDTLTRVITLCIDEYYASQRPS